MKTNTQRAVKQRSNARGGRPRRGYVLITFALGLMLLLGSAGLTFDIGRMYIVKNEAQSYCDAAAISAALKLDGTVAGIGNARAAALAAPKQWNFGTTAFDPARTVVTFAKVFGGPWEANPSPAADYIYARVATGVRLPMFLMPVLTAQTESQIGAHAIAKQVQITGTPNNIFPFAPLWLPPGGSTIAPPSEDPYNMVPAIKPDGSGLQHGGIYTLRGPSNIKNLGDMCENDATQLAADYRKAGGQPARGYLWDSNSAQDIRDQILGNEVPPDSDINIGDNVIEACDYCLVNGTKQSEVRAVKDRVNTDTDPDSVWYQDYVNAGNDLANSRRIVVTPVVTAVCGTLPTGQTVTCPPPGTSNTVVGFASFFLRPATNAFYDNGGNYPICAEYIGPSVPNSTMGGGSGTGGFVIKLVE